MAISKNYAHGPVPGQIPQGLTLIPLQCAYDPVCVLSLSNFSPEVVEPAALIMKGKLVVWVPMTLKLRVLTLIKV